ncbi:ferritin light chain-like [Armigeres subalbatus]|uniref:ferritin light chain-like n=1 Tax=Armigeres subalbatus TaxID=124917 RepID=UPI002ED403AB
MALFVKVTLVALLAVAANAAQSDLFCMADTKKCTARFSGYRYVTSEISDLTTQLLDQSFDFLFLSTAFNQHIKNRPGFEKVYRKISDQAWSDTMSLMKYQSKRGQRASFNPDYKYANHELRALSDPLLAEEHSSLKLALEYEKLVAEVTHAIHKKSSVAHQHPAQYDPDVAHFFDEHIVKGRSDSVRKLTGYIHQLDGILNGDSYTKDMGLYMFDQYLTTVE